MQVPYLGRYINLDRSSERREKLESQLREFGLQRIYSRFPAIDGARRDVARGAISGGAYGCFASHAQLIREACAGGKHLHVLEDDAVLSKELVPALDQAIAAGFLDQFDLLFTDIFVPPFVSMISALNKARRENTHIDSATRLESVRVNKVFDLRDTSWACTSSYVVAQRSLGRVAKLLDEALAMGPPAPLDIALRAFVNGGLLKAGCLVPFVTSIDLRLALDSTIRGGSEQPDLNRLAHNLLRQTFFVDPDWNAINAILTRYFSTGSDDARRRTVATVMDFVMFGNSSSF